MRWVPVTELLPDSDTTVMTFESESIEPIWPGFHDGEEWMDIMGGSLKNVTHWMDFPDPPK
ncbi:MAG: DUF551 domain-containing protein [Desulfuromonadales bacterium]